MVNGKQVLLKSKNNALFPISKSGPSNVLVQKDTVPTLGSTNYLDSNAIYEALTYKSDLDWVKDRVKNYAFPDYSRGTNIVSDWPLSGWTNNLGNGFLLLTLKAGSTVSRKRLTLWLKLNESAYAKIFQYGTLGDDSCVGPIIPVLDGYTYILVSDENTDITSSVPISDNKRIIPHTATFYPIKF